MEEFSITDIAIMMTALQSFLRLDMCSSDRQRVESLLKRFQLSKQGRRIREAFREDIE